LAARDWPGNVRELAQVLRRIILDADQFPVTADEVSRALENGAFGVEAGALEPERRVSLPARLAEVRRRLESSWILLALKEARGHHSRAAHALGINRKTLYEKMERYGLRGEITRED
jgi:two-component system response regulator AauR